MFLTHATYVSLVFMHTKVSTSYKLKVLRDLLTQALKEFPNNTFFLWVFFLNEERTKIENSLRRQLDDLISK
jgi:hypothetical protein